MTDLSTTPNGDANSLLETMLARATAGDLPSPQELLLAQLGDSDPTVTALARYFATQRARAAEEAADDADDDEDQPGPPAGEREALLARYADLSRVVQDLNLKIKQLFAELQTLRTRNDDLAAATGACYLCWGDDIDCPICGGNGQSGFFPPDPEQFAHYVLPTVQRLRRLKKEEVPQRRKRDTSDGARRGLDLRAQAQTQEGASKP